MHTYILIWTVFFNIYIKNYAKKFTSLTSQLIPIIMGLNYIYIINITPRQKQGTVLNWNMLLIFLMCVEEVFNFDLINGCILQTLINILWRKWSDWVCIIYLFIYFNLHLQLKGRLPASYYNSSFFQTFILQAFPNFNNLK